MSVGQASTPFLTVNSFETEHDAPATDLEIHPRLSARSPSVSVYESALGASVFEDPIREAYSSLVDEHYDEEFD